LRVATLGLEDFRNFERVGVEFAPGLNLIVGRNAQGKTNLLESIFCLGGLGSPRSPDAVLVRRGRERALLHGLVVRSQRTVKVDVEVRPGRGTRALVNGTPAPPGALNEVSVSVFFGPDELSLIKGSPDGRRRFLDDLVVRLRPTRQGLRQRWERVLRQRNALLRSLPRGGLGRRAEQSAGGLGRAEQGGGGRAEQGGGTLAVWDESFCRAGAALASARLEALGRLLPYARKRYAEVAGGGHVDLAYVSSWLGDIAVSDAPDEGRLREALAAAVEKVRLQELERGVSLVGPQRDDVAVGLYPSGEGSPVARGSGRAETLEGPLDARIYASQGDQRTVALALKLGESDLLADSLGEQPILLLDDVFSELDPARRAWLSDAVRGRGQQVLVSSAEPGAVGSARADLVLTVEGGGVSIGG
jgi:DNA replication and repair protein RecF